MLKVYLVKTASNGKAHFFIAVGETCAEVCERFENVIYVTDSFEHRLIEHFAGVAKLKKRKS